MRINSKEELFEFLEKNLVTSAEAAAMLGCSTQNIDDLKRRGKLRAVYATKYVRLFLREDIEARR